MFTLAEIVERTPGEGVFANIPLTHQTRREGTSGFLIADHEIAICSYRGWRVFFSTSGLEFPPQLEEIDHEDLDQARRS